MLNFGIELEVLVKYEDIDNFLKVIDNHAKELLIRNKDFLGNNHYLFTLKVCGIKTDNLSELRQYQYQ